MKTETKFWQGLKTRLLPHLPSPTHVQRLEPGSAAPGCPDVNICAAGREVWIENKVVSRGRKVSTLTAAQVAWLTRRAHCGGRVWIVCLHVPTDEVLVWPGKMAQEVMEKGIFASPSCRLTQPWDARELALTLLS